MGWRPSTTLDVVVVALALGPASPNQIIARIREDEALDAAWTRDSTPWWSAATGADRANTPPSGWQPQLSYANVRNRVLKLERQARARQDDDSLLWHLCTGDERAELLARRRGRMLPLACHLERLESHGFPGCTASWSIEETSWGCWLRAEFTTPRGTVSQGRGAYHSWSDTQIAGTWDAVLGDVGL